MAQITKYASDVDGKEFNTLGEQLAYDAAKNNEAAITAFLNRHYPVPAEGKVGPGRKIVEKGIALWLGEQAGVSAESENEPE